MNRLNRLAPVLVAAALLLPTAPSTAAPAAVTTSKVVTDPRGDARGHEGAGAPAKQAADILWTRYDVADRNLRVTWRIVEMTKRRTPILEVEGKIGHRRFTVDVSRFRRLPTVVEFWVGADERSCRGLDGFIDRGRDVGGFWIPLRCLPDGRFAEVQSYALLEADQFASDKTRETSIRIR